MKKTALILVAALAAVLSACSPPEGEVEAIQQPIIQLTTAFPGTSVTLAVGQWTDPNYPVINEPVAVFWHNNSCTMTGLGLAHFSQLDQDVEINLSGSTFSEVVVLGQGQTKGFNCSGSGLGTFTLTAVNQGTRSIKVEATPGADYMNCLGKAGSLVHCIGGSGNDILETGGTWPNANVILDGYPGDDKIRAFTTLGVTLKGDYGNDCIYTQSSVGTVDCGGNTDYVSVPAGTITNACEFAASNCN